MVVEGLLGGYCPAKQSDDTTLLDIISATGKTMNIHRCLEADEYCCRSAVPTYSVCKVYTILQQQIEDRLSEIMISELLGEESPKKTVSITGADKENYEYKEIFNLFAELYQQREEHDLIRVYTQKIKLNF